MTDATGSNRRDFSRPGVTPDSQPPPAKRRSFYATVAATTAARLVGVDQPPQATFLEVTTRSLNATSSVETTRFHRVEARRGNQSLHGCGRLIVVGGIEQRHATRRAVGAGCERCRAERSNPTGLVGSTTTLPSSRSDCSATSCFSLSSQTARTTVSACDIASRTGAAEASGPSCAASCCAWDWSSAASTTGSRPRTRCCARALPRWPTPMMAVVMTLINSTR